MDSDKEMIVKLKKRIDILFTLLVGLVNQKHGNKVTIDRKLANSYSYERKLDWNLSEDSAVITTVDKAAPSYGDDAYNL